MITEAVNIPQCDYRADKRLSASDCKLLLKDAYAFKVGVKQQRSEALDIGSLTHEMVLEPQNVDRDFLILDRDFNLRKKEDKELFAEYEHKALCENKILIKQKDFLESKSIADAVLNSEIGHLFKNGFAEKSFFGEVFDMPCKCRPDYFLEADGGIVIDFKTTKAGGSDPKEFSRTCANFGYHIQARFYLELLQAQSFLFIVVEKEAPYRIGVYQLGEASLDVGANQIKKAFEIYKNLDKIEQIRKTEDGSITQTIEIPNYALFD